MKIFFANKNMTFIEWKYFYQILLLFGNHNKQASYNWSYTCIACSSFCVSTIFVKQFKCEYLYFCFAQEKCDYHQ